MQKLESINIKLEKSQMNSNELIRHLLNSLDDTVDQFKKETGSTSNLKLSKIACSSQLLIIDQYSKLVRG